MRIYIKANKYDDKITELVEFYSTSKQSLSNIWHEINSHYGDRDLADDVTSELESIREEDEMKEPINASETTQPSELSKERLELIVSQIVDVMNNTSLGGTKQLIKIMGVLDYFNLLK